MTRYKTYIQQILRLVFAMVALMVVSPARALVIDRNDGYYLIDNAEDFIELTQEDYYWAHKVKLTADIDLGGDVIVPIGNGTVPFSGTFDGQGHVVSNAKILWNNAVGANLSSFGLFGFINGTSATSMATVCNLQIRDFTFTRTVTSAFTAGKDVKIGVLAGAVGSFSIIHDIAISQCLVTDAGKDPKAKAFHVGGAVGDFAVTYEGTANLTKVARFEFKNIFVNVDFDLAATTRSTTTDLQSNIGGILGRIRSGTSIDLVPVNTVYTGQIVAPLFAVSPTIANMRSGSGLTLSEHTNLYAGELRYTTNTKHEDYANKPIYQYFKDKNNLAGYETFCSKRMYYDYRVYNSSSGNIVDVDATTPPLVGEYSDDDYDYHTRTFLKNKDLGVISPTNRADWAYLQGVNFGKYSNPRTDASARASMLATLNAAVSETVVDDDGNTVKKYSWVWNEAARRFELVRNFIERRDLEVVIETSVDGSTFTARVQDRSTWEVFGQASDGEYQWECSPSVTAPEWSEIAGANSPTITPDRNLYYRVKWTYQGQTLTSAFRAATLTIYVYDRQNTITYNNKYQGDNVYNLDTDAFNVDGDDTADGLTPFTPVKTLAAAYARLNVHGSMVSNRIVVMGCLDDPAFLASDERVGSYSKPATILGTDYDAVSGGVLMVTPATDPTFWYLQAPLCFETVTLMMKPNPRHLIIACNYFDLTVSDNVYFVNFLDMGGINGLPGGINTLPYITIVGGIQDNNMPTLTYPSDEIYADMPNFYTEPQRVNIVLKSGAFGRVICSGRNNQVNGGSKNITGQPQKPSRTKLTVNITGDISQTSPFTKYCLKEAANPAKPGKMHFVNAGYTHNIGILSGGQTDGSVWGDIEMNIYAGYIARVITGNISYGRPIPSAPSDSFWGRSVLNIYGKATVTGDADAGTCNLQSDTYINEIFGGVLGRFTAQSSATSIEPYFYGESIINIYGGCVGRYRRPIDESKNLHKLAAIEPSIYGAGAGGVAGLGDKDNHTSDLHIPYVKAGVLNYGAYAVATGSGCTIPTVRMFDGTELDLHNTTSQVNIYSGVVEGNIYGAGMGFSDQLVDDPAYCLRSPKHTSGGLNGIYTLGNVYGNTSVSLIRDPNFTPPAVLGNIYGSGAGDLRFAHTWSQTNPSASSATNPFRMVATQYGDCNVTLETGTVGNRYTNTGGDVYGGAMGEPEYNTIAAIYGSSSITVSGATVFGNIFGGSQMADIYTRAGHDDSGNTYVTVTSGIVGNNIFGGSRGIDKDAVSEGSSVDVRATIYGSTHVDISGGNFINTPYVNMKDNTAGYRTFNIYGGGYQNCVVKGDANVDISSSLLRYEGTLMPPAENPNAWAGHDASVFQAHYMDVTFRRFCVYGGGYGIKTNALNTNVHVTIPADRPGVTLPHGYTLTEFLAGQSFFDIAGGGYSGDIGYWANADGTPLYDIDSPDETDYDHYVGGACNVLIDGYTYARKIIGGGFYGSCNTTNTRVKCGSLRQVYGGSLLGYVHQSARLQFGNRIEDFLPDWDGDDSNRDTPEYREAAERSSELNHLIFITENVYGGNDVKGIIGTTRWTSPDGEHGIESTDRAPLFCADIDPDNNKGIFFSIYGGTFMGNVYGAGNGHYRGYYVPEWVRYSDGPARMYRQVRSSVGDRTDPDNTARVYRSRPMVGTVKVHMRGNSSTDSISIHGNFFGGGSECTIGQWDTFLPFEDPRRLVAGGHLHVNLGGHVHIDGDMFLGSEGNYYSSQPVLPEGIDLDTFDGSTTGELIKLGEAAYGHWYFNTARNRYEPGYPEPGEVDGNFGMTGLHMLYGYMKGIEMEGDVELTFYRHFFERDDDNHFRYDKYGQRITKRWLPGEQAINDYDADHITMRSFYLGGMCGTMSNNNVQLYNYGKDGVGAGIIDENDAPALIAAGNDVETWGAIYRITIPRGVTIQNLLVMGSKDATARIYPYTSAGGDCTGIDTEAEPYYSFEGGLVTHTPEAFDLIVYNDKYSPDAPQRDLPDGFYAAGAYSDIRDIDEYVMQHSTDAVGNPLKIYRFRYDPDNSFVVNEMGGSANISDRRYGLAVTKDGAAVNGYVGIRSMRRVSDNRMTATKLTTDCRFDPQVGDLPADPSADDIMRARYGGIIYGGCYNTGVIQGDVILNVASNMLGDNIVDTKDCAWTSELSQLGYNIGRVFGGGYGADSRVDGDTYINLLNDFTGMNVFGGGMLGPVNGNSQINYIGSENGFVYGGIYGGGFRGTLGLGTETVPATLVELISGNVSRAFGGSCMGNINGSTHVRVSDQVTSDLSHLDYERLLKLASSFTGWGGSRLIVGEVYGGNDIAGDIVPPVAADPANPGYYALYSTTAEVYEKPEAAAATAPGEGPGKDTPGAANGYNGFPLVGSLYGGSNGDYGTGNDGAAYTGGTITVATGLRNTSTTRPLEGLPLPTIDRSHILIRGGTVINAYAGGNQATITESAHITIDYDDLNIDARAGFRESEMRSRVFTMLNLVSQQQFEEVTDEYVEDGAHAGYVYRYQIYRLFGGNNNADMAIQPDWDLRRGYIGSLYSGGNFGKMTYFDPETGKGLTLSVNSDLLRADYVYGGGRVGDINPAIPAGYRPEGDPFWSTFYGATLNIGAGIIDHVYGGNDVAGYVSYGTDVNITGAISGDVYCAGNGNYLYKYDRRGSLFDYSNPKALSVKEDYQFDNNEYHGARYFMLKAIPEYGFDPANPSAYDATDAQVLMAINAYRPNVERSRLYITGTSADNPAWVRGNVYCGGNSSTIAPRYIADPLDPTAPPVIDYDVKFEIGSNVIINGVFMGSNGEELATGDAIYRMETINGVDAATPLRVAAANDLVASQIPAGSADETALDKDLYPTLLDLYMRAVEVVDTPADFSFSPTLDNAYIGEFCLGGNRGSMMTDKTITLEFPERLTIFNRIIGGCRNANVVYDDVLHVGGLTKPLAGSEQTKVHLIVRSKFEALELKYPGIHSEPPIRLDNYMVRADGTSAMVEQRDVVDGREVVTYVVDPSLSEGDLYYRRQQCNIFGGCYDSGRTVGYIKIDLYSDMLNYDTDQPVDKRAVINGINDKSWRTFTVIGGGYGQETEVYGNVYVSMLPGRDKNGVVTHPSAATIFGGSQEGLVVGNTFVEVRDGKILGDVYGGSEAAPLYGSTHVIVGYPKYYRAIDHGRYALNRVDYMSETAVNDYRMEDGRPAIPRSIMFCPGDLLPANTYSMIEARVKDPYSHPADEAQTAHNSRIESIMPGDRIDITDPTLVDLLDPADDAQMTPYFVEATLSPTDFGVTWNDIDIWIGDQRSIMYIPQADGSGNEPEYYGHGNIYGGGYVPRVTTQSIVGTNTVLRFTDRYRPMGLHDYSMHGGNTNVMIGDNPANADLDNAIGSSVDGVVIRDHVRIGTGRYVRVAGKKGLDKMGLFKLGEDKNTGTVQFMHQPPGRMTEGDLTGRYYRLEADGGIYGGGRKVFVESFRSIDIAYYGYAGSCPQYPAMLNTLQRADVVSVTDCCMMLVGASDFTTTGDDYTLYAVNRVGELRMVSSLDPDGDIDGGVLDENYHNNHIAHINPRSRNYIALFHTINHLGAFRSNWLLEHKHHDANGKASTTLEEVVDGEIYGYTNMSHGYISYVNQKHHYIDRHNAFLAIDSPTDDQKDADYLDFQQRNVGTSANMLGINNGSWLNFESLSVNPNDPQHPTIETMYYGPAFGVAEIKLLTLAMGEGGGFIYALNHHYEPAIDNDDPHVITSDWCGKWKQDFLQTTGNFVFPGAAFLTTVEEKRNFNFIIDDCMPHGHGYYSYLAEHTPSTPKPGYMHAPSGSAYNVNRDQEVHYWYVNGTVYRYNVTVTGVTFDDPQQFFTNNEDDVINLVSLEPRASIKVKEVIWRPHTDEEYAPGACDITNLDKDYRLFISVDHDSRDGERTSADNGAYFTEIPRYDFMYDEGGQPVIPEGITSAQTVSLNDPGVVNAYDDYTIDGTTYANLPRLGIRLDDNVLNRLANDPPEVGRRYFADHLSRPHFVQIVLEAQNPAVDTNNDGEPDEEQPVFTYYINLTINYLLGPLIHGKIQIENCALPGEYIYANANDVEIDMDEDNLGITRQFWHLYVTNPDGSRNTAIDPVVLTLESNPENFNERNERILHLPALYYQNGWELTFGMEAGRFKFESTLDLDDDDSPLTRLDVHNYHRMKPKYLDGVLDLELVPGARVYIENDEDMDYFLDYLERHQDADQGTTPDGVAIGPQYCRGIDFYLMSDVNLPDKIYDHNGAALRFEGRFHGNGHRINLGADRLSMNIVNAGWFYNTGFISDYSVNDPAHMSANPSKDEPHVFTTVTGTIQNCFYFNNHGEGMLVLTKGNIDTVKGHHLWNNYQNSHTMAELVAKGYNYDELMSLSTDAFRYGQVAYNLNGFYLQRRHRLLHDFGAENNTVSLRATDLSVRATTAYTPGDYLEQMFNDGEYRYAIYDPFGEFPEMLRTSATPNYRDRLNQRRNGLPVSMHDTAHPVDAERQCQKPERTDHEYHPIFERDYIFWGEDIQYDVDDTNDNLPAASNGSNRVYRIAGFYGNGADKGYFVNQDAYVESPNLTAIDFYGYRDKDLYDASTGKLKDDIRSDIENDGWYVNSGHHEVLYPPTLDLPWTDDGEYHNFTSITVNSDRVTRNLLIYTRNKPESDSFRNINQFHYTVGPVASIYTRSDADIRAHHIYHDETYGPTMFGGYFQLVDCENFFAPVGFRVLQAWYNRRPQAYADEYGEDDGPFTYKTAWEGICLPFTIRKVFAATTNSNYMPNMGEITHFYGDEDSRHEYWLRRFEGVNNSGGVNCLLFHRPTAANEAPGTDFVQDYHYSNTALSDAYKDSGYNFDHDVLYHFDDPTNQQRVISDYRYLTASIPYIVTYPGDRYYEFDLSGSFYASKHSHVPGAIPQTISYLAKEQVIDGDYIMIPETQVPVAYTHDGVSVRGTFVHVTNDATLSENVLYDRAYNLAVLDAYLPNAAEGSREVHHGEEFVAADASEVTVVLPFRTYATTSSAMPAPARIASTSRTIVAPGVETPEEQQTPADELDPGVEVWTEGATLVIRTPRDMDTYIYNMLGQAVRHIRAYEGVNRYSGLPAGFYIVCRTKFRIP